MDGLARVPAIIPGAALCIVVATSQDDSTALGTQRDGSARCREEACASCRVTSQQSHAAAQRDGGPQTLKQQGIESTEADLPNTSTAASSSAARWHSSCPTASSSAWHSTVCTCRRENAIGAGARENLKQFSKLTARWPSSWPAVPAWHSAGVLADAWMLEAIEQFCQAQLLPAVFFFEIHMAHSLLPQIQNVH